MGTSLSAAENKSKVQASGSASLKTREYYNTSHYNTRLVSKLRMDIRKLFGTNVKRYREAAGLSQAEIAARMGVDRAYVSAIERGLQNATLLSIWEIAQALEVRPGALLEEPDFSAPSSDN